MSYLDSVINKMLALTEKKVMDHAAFRAIVVSVSGGKVQLSRLEAGGTPGAELYARVAGFTLAAADEVLVVPVGSSRKYVVIGKLQRAAPTGYEFDAPLTTLEIGATDITADTGIIDDIDALAVTSDHYFTGGSAPGATKLTAAGTTGTASIISGSSDSAGVIQLIPGGTGIAAGAIFSIDFSIARPNSSYSLLLTPGSAAARTLGLHLGPSSRTTTAVTVTTATALTSGSTYQWHYWIVGG